MESVEDTHRVSKFQGWYYLYWHRVKTGRSHRSTTQQEVAGRVPTIHQGFRGEDQAQRRPRESIGGIFLSTQIMIIYVPVVSSKVFKGKYVIKIIVRQGDPARTYHFAQKIEL